MHQALRQLPRLRLSSAELRRLEASFPVFLCPALLDPLPRPATPLSKPLRNARTLTTSAQRRDAAEAVAAPVEAHIGPPQSQLLARALPLSCPGCGALTQTIAPEEAGFYSESRNAVRTYLNPRKDAGSKKIEDRTFDEIAGKLDKDLRAQLGLPEGEEPREAQEAGPPPLPVCDRCHNLIHHHAGVPIHHPSIESIEATISESPHKYNHIYHVLDAADFPMSLVPNLTRALHLSPLRTQNRRSKHREYQKGRVAEVSFIITRSDLLAPKKEQVDSLMPYLVEVLRDALGRTGKNVRLGNVRCVSSKRGWWTKEVKESIWDRGGAGWFVGKVNVGKSNLFEVVFPKGRNDMINIDTVRAAAAKENLRAESPDFQDLAAKALENEPQEELPNDEDIHERNDALSEEDDIVDEESLLPPAQPETAYPLMPTISSLPGTTASPIRIPFGKGRGELIDLPGLARSTLDMYVRPEHKLDLIMKSRVVPERLSVKPGQSLLLGGGLIRITPTTRDIVYLVHAFVPAALKPHVTATHKAIGIQTGQRATGIHTIVEPSTAEKVRSAGRFPLRWDVTRKQAGPLTARDAVALKPEQLRFVVWSADVLVEGVGWVEIVAQTSKAGKILRGSSGSGGGGEEKDGDVESSDALGPLDPRDPDAATDAVEEIAYPEIEVFSPEGRFVALRRPMGAWLLGGPKPKKAGARKSRPRISMASVKGRRAKGTGSG